jgi:hypothetical protein
MLESILWIWIYTHPKESLGCARLLERSDGRTGRVGSGRRFRKVGQKGI